MTLAPADMLCFALHSTAQAVHAAYGPLLAPFGLTYPQYLALSALAQGDMTVGQLGAALRLETNTLTPLLKRMEQSGWLTRSRDTGDERVVRLSLTDAGRSLGAQTSGVPGAFAERTGLSQTQLADLRDILAVLRDRLKPGKA